MLVEVGEVEGVAQPLVQGVPTHYSEDLRGLPSNEPGKRLVGQPHDASSGR